MRNHDLILAIVATDRTFERSLVREKEAWVGKCIHCNKHLVVGLDGRPISKATVEHIRARSQGGTDDLENLALACAGCNHDKGSRHDRKKAGDPKLEEIVARLGERRRARWRDPPKT